MNPDTVPLGAWFGGEILLHGLVAVIAVTAVALVALWCAIGAVCHLLERRHTRHIPAAPDNQPGTNHEDLWTCRRIEAQPLAVRKEKKP